MINVDIKEYAKSQNYWKDELLQELVAKTEALGSSEERITVELTYAQAKTLIKGLIMDNIGVDLAISNVRDGLRMMK